MRASAGAYTLDARSFSQLLLQPEFNAVDEARVIFMRVIVYCTLLHSRSANHARITDRIAPRHLARFANESRNN